MIFKETPLNGAFVVEPEPRKDGRGYFARTFCQEEFGAHGLETVVKQCNVSFNQFRGTLRGMHYQVAPKAEAKLVRCTKGRVYDVIIDLRPGSSTYCKWLSVELGADNGRMLYVPAGFAHGFQTREDDSEVFYLMFEAYSPEHARGVRWNDAAFGVEWPFSEPIMSDKDRAYGDFTP